MLQAITSKWEAYAESYIKIRYPVHALKTHMDIPSTATAICDKFSDVVQVARHSLYKLYVVNMTYLGYEAMTKEAEITTIIRAKLGDDPEHSCALIITPNTGPYKQTYDDAAAESVRRGLLDNLRDEQNQLLVKDCSIFFNLKSMW